MKTFGQYLKELRRSSSKSQRALAEYCELDYTYVSKIENDRMTPPSPESLKKMALFLEVPYSEMLAAAGLCVHCFGSGKKVGD